MLCELLLQKYLNIYNILTILYLYLHYHYFQNARIVINYWNVDNLFYRSSARFKVLLVLSATFIIFLLLQITKDKSGVDFFRDMNGLLAMIYQHGNETFLGLYSAISIKHNAEQYLDNFGYICSWMEL